MGIDLYYGPASPPSQAVILGAKAIGVRLNLKLIDLFGGGTRSAEFVKINPQHKVPTLDDNGFVLSESRAILRYLVNQYAKDDSLYPKDPKKRAVVEQRLDFDLGTLYQRFMDYYYPQMLAQADPDPEKFKNMEEAVSLLNQFLEGEEWVAGSNITIADIFIATSVATHEAFGFPINKFPNVVRWFEKYKKTIPSYDEVTRKGLVQFKQFFDENSKK